MPVVFDWRMLGVFSFQAVFVGFFLSLFCLSPVFAQPGYTISQPAWTNAPAITGGTNITFTSQNDAIASVITIPFYFRFYGNNYNTLYINTNGWVAFTAQVLATANTNSNPVALPNAGTTIPKNCIMGPWQDWNNTGGSGVVRYRTDGASPNRRFVVTYNAWPMNGCLTTNGTFQIVLNECTNVIDIYIYQKPACANINSNRAVLGMQNLAGTVAHVVPGRHNASWNVPNTAPELHRFTPDNPVINGNALISVGATTQLTPSIAGGTWSSATPAIATVSATGLVTGVSPGSAVITYNVAQAGTSACQRVTRTVTSYLSQSGVSIPQVNSCENDTVVAVTITHPSLNGVANAALRVTYNLDSLTYVGSSNLNPAFNGMVVNGVNGVVTLDWNTSTNQNITAGNMVNLRFRVNGSSALTWDTILNPSEFSDVNFNVVPQTFQSGSVTNRTLRYQWQRQICQGQSLQMGGQTFSTGGNYQVVLPGSGTGCDTIVNLTLSVLSTQTSISGTTCSNQPYLFDGINLISSGVYRDTLVNIIGCDSVVTLNLTVRPAYTHSVSVVTCPGSSFNFGNQILTTSGTYTSSFTSIGGCDSVVQLNLTFADSIRLIAQGGVNGFCPGGSVRLNSLSNSPQGTYRWIFNGNAISSATADTLRVNQAGTYQMVVVLTPTCTLYSNILSITELNCNQIAGDLRYDNANLTPLAGVPVHLKTLLGNVVASDTTDSSGTYALSGYANGNYILEAQIGYNSGGINSTDALLVSRYFTSLITLSPLRARTGDVNGNLVTNSGDALLISRSITNLLLSFPVGNFVHERPPVDAQGNPIVVSMRALSTGDVNGSFNIQPTAPVLVLDTVYSTFPMAEASVRFTTSGSGIFERGVCWGTSPSPTIFQNKSIAGTGGFGFTHSLGGVTGGTLYYVRAYARNSSGTVYSNERSFTHVTWGRCPGTPSVTDVDGNSYNTVQIGTQCWTQSNLKVSKYRDGSSITNITDATQWSQTNTSSTGAWCNYNNDAANEAIYGKLYNGYAVSDSRGLCPTGWHVPTDGEWTTLENHLGGAIVAGGAMKSTTGWTSPNVGATNSSGFTALPGGNRNDSGGFSNVGNYGNWWSSSDAGSGNSWCRTLGYDGAIVYRNFNGQRFGFSVRCARD